MSDAMLNGFFQVTVPKAASPEQLARELGEFFQMHLKRFAENRQGDFFMSVSINDDDGNSHVHLAGSGDYSARLEEWEGTIDEVRMD